MSTSGVLRILLSLAVGGGLVALLLSWSGTPPSAILDALRQLDPQLLCAALFVQGSIYPLRALRFRALLHADPPASLRRLVPATAAHSLVAYLLPAKLGEASLIIYLERGLGVERARGLAVLLVARALDFAGVTLALTMACLVIGALDLVPSASAWLLPLGGVLLVPAFLLTWVALRGASCVAFCRAILTRTRITRVAPGAFLDRIAAKVEDALREVSGTQLLRAAIWTVPIWALVFGYYGMLARGLGLDTLGPFEAVFGASLAVLSNLLPINGFAGFGTQDGGWLFGYMAMGASEQAAMASGLAFHVIYIAGMGLFGVIGHAFASTRRG